MTLRLPRRVSEPLLRRVKKPMDAFRADEAATVLDRPVRYGDFSTLTGSHVLLVTWKRDGTAMPSPVWFARDGERVYVWTEVNAWKAKRLRNNPAALLAPCTVRGVPLGDPVAATGRVLTDEAERDRAARVIRRSWSLGQRLFEAMSRPLTEVHYLEFIPASRVS